MSGQDSLVLSTLTYIVVERKVHWYDQRSHQSIHSIDLFNNMLTTTKDSFQLEHIHDISYRPFTNGNGLFYLHTNQGVFTYTINADPTEFIDIYRNIK